MYDFIEKVVWILKKKQKKQNSSRIQMSRCPHIFLTSALFHFLCSLLAFFLALLETRKIFSSKILQKQNIMSDEFDDFFGGVGEKNESKSNDISDPKNKGRIIV